jgi:hypothetical protein
MASDPGRLQGRSARGLVRMPFRSFMQRIVLMTCFQSSAALSFSLAEQEVEENFDLSLLATLEIDAVPPLGSDLRIPDRLVVGLAKCLERASLITEDAGLDFRDFEAQRQNGLAHEGNGHAQGTTQQLPLVPRERFSYWCLDLLFLLCSDVAKGKEAPFMIVLVPS